MKYRYIFRRLGKEIARIRKERNLSQENLAFEACVDRSCLALIEEYKTRLLQNVPDYKTNFLQRCADIHLEKFE